MPASAQHACAVCSIRMCTLKCVRAKFEATNCGAWRLSLMRQFYGILHCQVALNSTLTCTAQIIQQVLAAHMYRVRFPEVSERE